eukprot:5418230-Prymnesium_polylepis.2
MLAPTPPSSARGPSPSSARGPSPSSARGPSSRRAESARYRQTDMARHEQLASLMQRHERAVAGSDVTSAFPALPATPSTAEGCACPPARAGAALAPEPAHRVCCRSAQLWAALRCRSAAHQESSSHRHEMSTKQSVLSKLESGAMGYRSIPGNLTQAYRENVTDSKPKRERHWGVSLA